MGRTNLPLSNLAAESATSSYTALADPAGTAADQGNGMNIALASTAIPSGSSANMLLLRVANSAGAPHNLIVRAGAYPPAFEQGKGDLTVAVTNGTTVWVGPLEGARHVQADGSINIDFSSGFTGTITAFLVPAQ